MSGFTYGGEELELFAHARNWKRYFSRLIKPFVTGRVLEVGAGIGETAQVAWNPGVHEWHCLEPDATLASRLHAVRFPNGTAPEVHVSTLATANDLGLFDAILYVDVLEHIRDDRGELQHAARHLSAEGHVVVLSPAYQWLYSEFDRALGHERRYTARDLRGLAAPELRVVRSFYADAVGAMLSLGNRFVLRQSLPTASQIRFWDHFVVPCSIVVDPLIARSFGRSVVAIYKRVDT